MNRELLIQYGNINVYVPNYIVYLYLTYKHTLDTIIHDSLDFFQQNVSLDAIVEFLGDRFEEVQNHEHFNNAVNEGFGEGFSIVLVLLIAILIYFFNRYREQHGGSASNTGSQNLCLHFKTPICAKIPDRHHRLITDIMNTLHAYMAKNTSTRVTRPLSSTKGGRRRRRPHSRRLSRPSPLNAYQSRRGRRG